LNLNRGYTLLKENIPLRKIYPTSWLVASSVFIFYSIIILANNANIIFFSLVRGKGLVRYVTDIIIFSHDVDILIWAISLLLVASIHLRYSLTDGWLTKLSLIGLIPLLFLLTVDLIYPTIYLLVIDGLVLILLTIKDSEKKLFIKWELAALLICILFFIIIIPIEIAALIRWVVARDSIGFPFSDSSWNLAFTEMQLSTILNPWLPRLILVFLISWLFRILSYLYQDDIRSFFVPVFKRNWTNVTYAQRSLSSKPIISENLIKWLTRSLLIVTILTAIFVASYPYSNVINPSQLLVGVDAGFYQRILNDMMALDFTESIGKAFEDPRSTTHLLHLSVAKITSTSTALQFTPVILSILLALTTYFLVKIGTGNSILSVIAALISVLSFSTTVGINAGFYGNWLALSLVNVAFACALIAIKNKHTIPALFSIVTFIVVLYTHPWTWTVTMIIVGIYGLITLFQWIPMKRKEYWELIFLTLLLVVNFAADVMRRYLLQQGGAELTISSLSPGFKIMGLSHVIGVLSYTFRIFLGGALANTLLILLAILGFLAISNYKGHFNRLLLSWAIVASVGVFFFGSPGVSSLFFHARSLYIIPFQIFAGIGLFAIFRISRTLFVTEKEENRYLHIVFNTLLSSLVFLVFMNYSLRILSALYPYVN